MSTLAETKVVSYGIGRAVVNTLLRHVFSSGVPSGRVARDRMSHRPSITVTAVVATVVRDLGPDFFPPPKLKEILRELEVQFSGPPVR